MTPEPFTIFARRTDFQGVVDVCRRVAGRVRVTGSEHEWRKLIVSNRWRPFRRRLELRITCSHKHSDSAWLSQQLSGLMAIVSGFVQGPLHPELQRVIQNFRIQIGFETDFSIESDDPRVAWVLAICRHLDGIIFTPSRLLDANGRIIVANPGYLNPEARLPRVEDAESEDECEDEEQAIEPPSATRVAKRAVVLAAIGNRGFLERSEPSMVLREEMRQSTLTWIRECGVDEELEPDEWKVLQRPCGTLSPQETVDATWRTEGLSVLLWALGLCDLPPYDETTATEPLYGLVAMFDSQATRDMIAGAKLRPKDDLLAYGNHATMVHWRIREFGLRPVRCNFVAMSKKCWIGTFDITRFRIKANDMMIGDDEIAKADPDRFNLCRSITMERHRAINWVLGDGTLYSETHTDT